MPKLKPNKPKPRPAKTGRATGSQNSGPNHAHHENVLVGLTDPFSPEAASARYPDTGAGRTLTFTQRMNVSVSSDANGTITFAVNPGASFPWVQQTSAAGNVTTWPATKNASGNFNSNLLNTYGQTFRPTSFGIRVLNTLSATTSSGYLIIAKGGVFTLGGTTTFSPNNFTSWETHPYTHGGEWHAVGLPRSAAAYDFVPVVTYNQNNSQSLESWETVYVACYGLPASASPMLLEVVLNYEYVALEDAPIAQLAAPQPVFDPQMQVAINAVQAAHPTSHKGARGIVSNFVRREAKKALVKHVIPFVAKKAAMALV